jgi:hypothetical protein
LSKARTWELRQDDVKGKRCQLACKPGSVWLRREPERGSHSSGAVLAHRLAQPTRMTGLETGCRRLRAPRHPYSVLLPVGFTMPSLSPATRWALTPPFHPYPASSAARWERDSRRGGILSVALSLGSPPPDVIRHRVSVEPGLSSPHRLSALVKRGCPANWPPPDNGVGNATPEETAAAVHLRNAASKPTP